MQLLIFIDENKWSLRSPGQIQSSISSGPAQVLTDMSQIHAAGSRNENSLNQPWEQR